MSLDGRIIEYLENGKFICALVMEDMGSRLRLLNQNSRELNLPLNRVVHRSEQNLLPIPARQDILVILEETAATRALLAEKINLAEIWETVAEKPEEAFTIEFLASLFYNTRPSDDQAAAFLRAVIAHRLYFKYKAGTIRVNSPETVALLQQNQEKEREEKQFIATNTAALLRIRENGRPQPDWKDQHRVLRLLADYYLFSKDAADHELARRLVKNSGLTGPHDIFHLLVKAGHWDANENIPLLRQEIPTRFSERALAEVSEIMQAGAASLSGSGRKDFSSLPVFTIDGPATRDFDDALHVEQQGENYLVGIHISDVGHFVPEGSARFEAALQRGTSIYFPDKHLAMLPPELSEGELSLLHGRERPAISFMVLLSPAAEVLRFEIVRSIISVRQQLTYQEADDEIQSDPQLAVLAQLSVLLRRNRVNRGALLLPMPDLHIAIGDDDTIAISTAASDTPARVLIAEFMILANTLGAQFVAEREAPGLFRCQGEPRQRIIDGFEDDIVKVIQQRKRLSPMSLLTSPRGHCCVGAPQYTTVTSPIRRLLDLVMQLQISSLVRGKGVLFSKKDMRHFSALIQKTVEKANQVKYLRQRYWILKYLQKRQGERVPAIVVDRGPRRVHIFLEEFLLDGDLPLNSAFRVSPGDTILVRIAKADPLGNIFRLEW
jgi:exoribonuclease-2